MINDNGKINIYLLSIPIIAGVILTIARGSFDFATRNEEMSFLFFMRRAYTYFIPLFDYYLKHPIEANFTASNTLGISTFENIFILINYPFRKLFGTSSYLFNYQPVNSITQDAVRINANLIINNQVSMYFRFLRDWGYLGICIGPVLLASFFDFLYRYALKDAFNFLLYAYTMASLLYSFSDLPFSDRRYLIVSILFLFFKKFILTKRKFA
ncbi:hypothetical protein FACS189450_15020 [Spirochaetia bacterium]|nr:hypothetical protein FACS189450_15020 [Spirochaetia bacterium]